MDDETAERARHQHLVQDAVARGQAALGSGDKVDAIRWLDRAHRLAPGDGTIAMLLASALIGGDNARASALFDEVLKSHDVRDAWLGLATARFLMGDLPGARGALAALLSRHASRPDIVSLAEQIVRATGAPGWCALTGAGVLVVHPARSEPIITQMDGTPVPPGPLPPRWPLAQQATVMAGERHLIGSPIALASIGRVEGHVEAREDGLHGWAWHPHDPDTDPRLSIGSGPKIAATKPVDGIPGLAPLARPRSFAIPWAELPTGQFRICGRDGRELSGTPVRGNPDDKRRAPPVSRAPSVEPALTPVMDQPVAAGRRHNQAWRPAKTTNAVILITHNDGGGVEQRVQTSIARHEANGRRAIVLRPAKPDDGAPAIAVESRALPRLRFAMPTGEAALLRLLRDTSPNEIELHHFLNHDPSMFQTIRALGVPYDVYIHDFAWFCPRIALVGRGDRYCGEPSPTVCEACVAEMGRYLHDDIPVAALIERSRDVLSGARRIIAPSRDAADRMERHFPGISPIVVPHEDDAAVAEPPPIPLMDGTVTVCVAGAIGLHKGFHVLLACARDARKRSLDLTFVVAGTTIDDQSLIDTGRVFVTGPYRPDEAVALIKAQAAALALLPSIWPETWCLGLTELWRAGLRVAAFDIGAPADRIRDTGRGFLLPLGLAPAKINDVLLNAAKGRSLLPIRRPSAYKPSR
jgi:glycosyltransferase involved in cell wall biosynthesis